MNDNIILRTDSYKVTHWKQYPPNTQHVYSYFESRGGDWPYTVFFGLQYYLKRYLEGQVVTIDKIDEAEKIFTLHFGNKNLFNRSGWEHIVKEHEGKLPVVIRAIPEGTIVSNHNVLMTIENTDPECFWLTNYLETLLVQVWYPTTVCTQSYKMKQIILSYLNRNGDPKLIDFKLHDFGFRGVSSVESAGEGGCAHLVNFKGTDTLEGIMFARNYYGEEMAGYSIPACYDDKTEILTGSGFKLFNQLTKKDTVAQYENGGKISFVKPIKIHTYDYNGDMYAYKTKSSVKKIDLLVTPNHRMIAKNKTTQNLFYKEAKDFNINHRNQYIQSGFAACHGEGISIIDRLKIAFQADGSYPSRKDSYTGSRKGTKPIRFSLHKKRKIKRLEWILKNLKWKYTKSYISKKDQIAFWICCPKEIQFDKTLSWIDIPKISSIWAQEFIEELQYWDGTSPNKKTIKYDTIVKENREIVQIIGILGGYRPHVAEYVDKRTDHIRHTVYSIYLLRDVQTIGGGTVKRNKTTYKGKIFCVTVPSGMIVVRRNNRACICGNSEHSTITAWGQNNEDKAMENMLDQYSGGLVAIVSDSFNIFEACRNILGKQLREKILNRDGIVIVRPDSGDPIDVLVSGKENVINILAEQFGYIVNAKGYKVLNPKIRIIQGDGIDIRMLDKILFELELRGWSADNISFGSGGGLLQKLNRDTLKFAFKCAAIIKNGKEYPVCKNPVTDTGKASKSGKMKLVNVFGKYLTVSSKDNDKDQLVEVFRDGKIIKEWKFSDIRNRTIL